MNERNGAVLDAAGRCLATNPRATMGEIAKAAGIGRTTLHRFFPTREALILALALYCIEASQQAVDAARLDEPPLLDALRRLFERLTPIAFQFAFLQYSSEIAMSEDLVERSQAMRDQILTLLRRGQGEGLFRPALPTIWIGYLLTSALNAAATATRRGDIAPNAAVELALSAFFDGVRAPTSTGIPPPGGPDAMTIPDRDTKGCFDERVKRIG